MLGMLRQTVDEVNLAKQLEQLNLKLAAQNEGRKMSYLIGGIFLFVKLIAGKRK